MNLHPTLELRCQQLSFLSDMTPQQPPKRWKFIEHTPISGDKMNPQRWNFVDHSPDSYRITAPSVRNAPLLPKPTPSISAPSTGPSGRERPTMLPDFTYASADNAHGSPVVVKDISLRIPTSAHITCVNVSIWMTGHNCAVHHTPYHTVYRWMGPECERMVGLIAGLTKQRKGVGMFHRDVVGLPYNWMGLVYSVTEGTTRGYPCYYLYALCDVETGKQCLPSRRDISYPSQEYLQTVAEKAVGYGRSIKLSGGVRVHV